jgi:flavorubredoxin
MQARSIVEDVWWMGAVDWNRRLFDSLIPLPEGTSYNAYLVQGSEKTALLDTVDPDKLDVLMKQLDDVPSVDYLVSHHSEQDHSGCIPDVLARYPQAIVVASPKGKTLLMAHLGIPDDRVMAVKDGETLSLGDKTLEFIHTPWVHWPETMVTYLREERILFTCDFFGSHLATTDLYVTDEQRIYTAAKRYYAEIMMPYRRIIEKNLVKVEDYDVRMIAPSHGPIYGRPAFILDTYKDWVSGPVKNEVVLPYVSMHGSTALMVAHLIESLVAKGVTVHPFDLTVSDVGELAMALVDAATLVVGTPTLLVGPHPLVFNAVNLANALRPKLKQVAIIGSYGWASKAVDQLVALIPNLKVDVLDPVLCKGLPGAADLEALDDLAAKIAAKHMEMRPI